jgi:hypothetical protein
VYSGLFPPPPSIYLFAFHLTLISLAIPEPHRHKSSIPSSPEPRECPFRPCVVSRPAFLLGPLLRHMSLVPWAGRTLSGLHCECWVDWGACCAVLYVWNLR